MQRIVNFLYVLIRRLNNEAGPLFSKIKTIILLYMNNVSFSSFKTRGCPYIMVARGAMMTIGDNFSMNNGLSHNPIGVPQKCTFFVDRNSSITIGNNVGISQSALVSHCSIIVEDDVKIGGGVCIYTTDFHSLDPRVRRSDEDELQRKCAPVVIKKNAFLGAQSIILKGVTVGENSIIGAGSVVTKDIPDNQIWGGNPAKFIRNI